MSTIGPAHDPGDARDRRAVEHVRSIPLSDDWPSGAIPPATRVKVIRDPGWDGPWRQEFVGVISGMGAPEPCRAARRAGVLGALRRAPVR